MSLLESLKKFTTVVADTGDIESMRQFKPQDATTNPSLILSGADAGVPAARRAALADADHAGAAGRRQAERRRSSIAWPVDFGLEILKIVPGRVSTEVDARLSFDTRGDHREGARAHRPVREGRHLARAHPDQDRLAPGRASAPPSCSRRKASTAT